MVKRRRDRGYTLMEVVVATALLGVFLMALVTLEGEMRTWERRLPINYMKHPQVSALLSRMRRDVLDAHGKDPYRSEYEGFVQSDKTLILESLQKDGSVQMVVWDFSKPGEVLRRSWNVGVSSDWVARGLPPSFQQGMVIDAVGIPGRPWAVRLMARDGKGNIAIDQIFQPRAHE